VKDGVRKTIEDRQLALDELVKQSVSFGKTPTNPLTLRGGDYAQGSSKAQQGDCAGNALLRCEQ
jgi:hypothetical protein